GQSCPARGSYESYRRPGRPPEGNRDGGSRAVRSEPTPRRHRRMRRPARTGARLGIAVTVLFVAALGSGVGAAVATPGTATDPTAVPLGDGRLSTTPKVGSVDSCLTSFPNVGGAQAVGPWVNTAAHTWNSTTKVAVQ